VRSVRIIGPGRAGGSLAGALSRAGWAVQAVLGRDDDVASAAEAVDLPVIATPDDAIAPVAASVEPVPATVVAHMAGSRGLDVLSPHVRVGALHPLVSLPTSEMGATRLAEGAWFAVAGDPLVEQVVSELGGRAFTVDDADRAAYHAAACIAANHLVALMGQVGRIAGSVDVPFDAYLELARATLENVADLGPAAGLTGPAARGDELTISRHLSALPPSERDAYAAMAAEARRLSAQVP
jgi:predicted short-subunit dehydrogenase-like oxidoreductase (DUF2520 family)